MQILKSTFCIDCASRFNFLRGLSNNDGNGLVQLWRAAMSQ